MKIVAAIFADFAESFLGGNSVLFNPLGTKRVIDHTLARASRIGGVDRCYLVIQPRDEAPAREALRAHSAISLLTIDDGARPRRRLIRAARKWGLRSWRGTPLATTWFDEYVEPLAVARVLDHCSAQAVLALDATQSVFDPEIASAMVAHALANPAEAPYVFTQAPPGLAGIVLGREILRDTLQQNLTIGLQFAYRPESPRMDIITKPMCFRVPTAVFQTGARFVPDTRESAAELDAGLRELGEGVSAEELCDWIRHRPRRGDWPREIEIELTTADPLPDSTLRPRGRSIGARALEDLDALGRVAREFTAAGNDRLVVLGGHGDPLLHPRFAECVRRIRSAGVCGLAVRTPLVELSAEALEGLFESRVDLLEVQLDAHSAAAFQRVHGRDAFERVVANVERIDAARRSRLQPEPILVPSMIRSAATLPEMEPFYDHWIRKLGSAVLRAYSTFGGALPADSAISLTSPVRRPCRKLDEQLVLLADGRSVACGEEATGRLVVGDWRKESLAAIWAGRSLAELREIHVRGEWQSVGPCASCDAWGWL